MQQPGEKKLLDAFWEQLKKTNGVEILAAVMAASALQVAGFEDSSLPRQAFAAFSMSVALGLCVVSGKRSNKS